MILIIVTGLTLVVVVVSVGGRLSDGHLAFGVFCVALLWVVGGGRRHGGVIVVESTVCGHFEN